jgi:hypothetical protein
VTSGDGDGQERPRGALLGWVLLAALFLYACFVHHGAGPPPEPAAPRWYHPRAFLFDCALLAPLLESPARAMATLGLPALLATGAIAIAGRSAVATALAASCTVATALFLFYGAAAPSVWKFFHWRGSAVIVLTALCAGFAVSAPLLVESWKRRGWALGLAIYLPVFLAVLALMRNATGTDPALRFAISPWPAIPVFGLEVAASFAALAFAGIALGVGGMARARTGGAAAAAAGIGLGLGVPPLLVWIASHAGMFPFEAGAASFWRIGAASAVGMALAATLRLGEPSADLSRRARRIAAAAALVAAPILAGHALSRHDYTVTREHRAQEIIDALQRYFDREEIYPDSLDELVASADLESVPEPQIGFGPLYAGSFSYQSFGISYVLDFPAPRWVQCAYNPPWEDEDGEGEEGDRSLGGAWSCPSAPPELW